MTVLRTLLTATALLPAAADLDMERGPHKSHKHVHSHGIATHSNVEPISAADVLANSQVLEQYHAYYHIVTGDVMDSGAYAGKPHQKGSNSQATQGTPSAFFLKAGILVLMIFAMIIDLSIKNAAEAYGGHFPFNPACGVVVVEYAKCVVSAILFAVYVADARSSGREVPMPRPLDVAWLAVPAGIYALNNLLVFQAIKSTPLSTFGVVRKTMLIWNALIWTATFRQSISAVRWMAIGGIFLGCCANQIPKMFNDEFTPGVFWAILLAFSNAAGAVANEYAMKQRAALDINLQNCILYTLCGSFVFIGVAICEPATVQTTGIFFTGFVPECWQVIILQVFTGLAVSRILKYVEAVTKTIVAAIRGPGVIFFGAILFHSSLGLSEVFATLVVCVSCWVYLRQGPLVKPLEVPKALQETDALLQKKAAV